MVKKEDRLGIYLSYMHAMHVRTMRQALDGKAVSRERLNVAVQHFISREGARQREKLFTSAEWSRILVRTGRIKGALRHAAVVYSKHMAVVQAHLNGESVPQGPLWVAVGYFAEGGGRAALNRFRLFTNAQWRKLLLDTGREPESDAYFSNG